MDCWNYSIKYLLESKNIPYEESEYIFSEVFEWVSLLSKIWIILLKYYKEVIIIHENKEIFVNLKEDEIPLKEEYIKWLNVFKKDWWVYLNKKINLDLLKEYLNNYECVIPIKKWEWSHLVVLKEIWDAAVSLIDNKKWEYCLSIEEFEELLDLYNWKYVLFCNEGKESEFKLN